MGKGDKKTKRGKIIMGSYGKKRPRKIEKSSVISDKPKKVKIAKAETISKKAPINKTAEIKPTISNKVVKEVSIPKTAAKEKVAKKAVVKKAPAKKAPAKKATKAKE